MKPLDKQKNELRRVQGLIRQHRIQEALAGLERLCEDIVVVDDIIGTNTYIDGQLQPKREGTTYIIGESSVEYHGPEDGPLAPEK